MNEPTAEVVSGGIQAGGSLIAGIFNYYAQKDANKQNLELAMLQHGDTLAEQKRAEKFAKEQFAFTKKEAELGREERSEERSYGRMQGAYTRAANLLAENMNLNQAKVAPFQKYVGRA